MTRILVMTDFSESAARAHAFVQKHFPDSDIKLLHAVDVVGLSDIGYGRAGGMIAASVITTQQDLQLEAQKKMAELGGGDVLVGKPVDVGLEVAERWGADLIAMGTAGKRGLERLFVGSVAEDMVRRSPVPVLTVRVTND
jgi:nucleotide-binding universal stress UspA family protein